jgi:hypothetical protein
MTLPAPPVEIGQAAPPGKNPPAAGVRVPPGAAVFSPVVRPSLPRLHKLLVLLREMLSGKSGFFDTSAVNGAACRKARTAGQFLLKNRPHMDTM